MDELTKLQNTKIFADKSCCPCFRNHLIDYYRSKINMIQPSIIVHSGAGYFPDERNASKLEVTRSAAVVGWETLLRQDNNVLDAVEAAVRVMEDNAECNAGYGSVLNSAGDVEMDAMIIRGKDLATGGLGGLCQISNPISVARRVLEKTKHCLLAGPGALEFAIREGFPIVSNESLVSPRAKIMLEGVLSKNIAPSTETGSCVTKSSLKETSLGTVGAVAINCHGEIAAATSTGGICAKMPGRLGDTPIPGGGTFCDDQSCGISATGLGESIMRVCLSSKIANFISNGMDPSTACLTALNSMTERVGGDGGAIVITKDGVLAHAHNSRKMTWASVAGDGELRSGVKAGEEFVSHVVSK